MSGANIWTLYCENKIVFFCQVSDNSICTFNIATIAEKWQTYFLDTTSHSKVTLWPTIALTTSCPCDSPEVKHMKQVNKLHNFFQPSPQNCLSLICHLFSIIYQNSNHRTFHFTFITRKKIIKNGVAII